MKIEVIKAAVKGKSIFEILLIKPSLKWSEETIKALKNDLLRSDEDYQVTQNVTLVLHIFLRVGSQKIYSVFFYMDARTNSSGIDVIKLSK